MGFRFSRLRYGFVVRALNVVKLPSYGLRWRSLTSLFIVSVLGLFASCSRN